MNFGIVVIAYRSGCLGLLIKHDESPIPNKFGLFITGSSKEAAEKAAYYGSQTYKAIPITRAICAGIRKHGRDFVVPLEERNQ